MIEPKFYPNLIPHYISNDGLIVSKGNAVFKTTTSFSELVAIANYKDGFIKNELSKNHLTSRIGRFGFHHLISIDTGYLAVQKGKILFKENGKKHFTIVFDQFQGSRPLNLLKTENSKVFFGEYFGNDLRKEVKIFGSDDGVHWSPVWTFKSGEIRHIHKLVWDAFRNGIWVLTGDTDTESGLWFTGDNFSTLTKVAGGSQKFRAVEIIPMKEGIIIPTDTPLKQNSIQMLDLNKNELHVLCNIPGSAFHSCLIDGIYLISTVTEPSLINKTDYATLWASLDGKEWRLIWKVKRDFIPVKYQNIFRYSEIIPTPGVNNSPYIVGFGRALKSKSNGILLWNKKEIRKMLS